MGRPAKPLTNKSGVYLLKVGDAHYVGSSKRLAKRIFEHERLLKAGSHTNKELQESYNQYQSILHEVLEFLPPDKDALLEAEQSYYDSMRSRVRLVNAGDHAHCWNKGKPVSEEMRDRISNTLKDSGVCKGEQNPFFGKKHSDDVVQKMTESHRKYVVSEKTKNIMRLTHIGRKIDPDTVSKRQASRVEGGKPYATRCDFIGYDEDGVEVVRYSSIKHFSEAGYCKGPLYKNMRVGTPYRGLYWKKESKNIKEPAC